MNSSYGKKMTSKRKFLNSWGGVKFQLSFAYVRKGEGSRATECRSVQGGGGSKIGIPFSM